MRKLSSKYTQKELGKMYGISQAMAGRIINNIVHTIDVHISGSAEVRIHDH
jgi:DNA-directed RNA polymerase specialized sigma subunit